MVTIKSMVVVAVYILFISLYLFWIVVGKARIKTRDCFGETPNSPFDKGHILQIVNVIDQL